MEKKEDKFTELSMKLSVDVLNLVKTLQEKKERIISNQIGRSATSICANIVESKYAHSRAILLQNWRLPLKRQAKQVNG